MPSVKHAMDPTAQETELIRDVRHQLPVAVPSLPDIFPAMPRSVPNTVTLAKNFSTFVPTLSILTMYSQLKFAVSLSC